MPTYEYICHQCGHVFEALRSMKDSDSPIGCTICNSQDTQRKLSVCNVNAGHASQYSSPSSSSCGCGGCSGGSCSSCGH